MDTSVTNDHKALIELAFEPIFARDFDGRILEWNRGAQRLYGYTQEEAVGAISHELLKTRFPIPLEELSSALEHNGHWIGTLVHTTRDGDTISVESRHQLFNIDNARYVLETNREVSAQRALFEHATEQMNCWQLVRDPAGNIQTWRLIDINPAGLKSWGKTREETIGKTADEIFPGTTEHFMPIVQKIFREGRPYKWETYFKATGEFLQITSIPFGEYFISTGSNVTAIKQAEQALRESEQNFRALVQASSDVVYRMSADWTEMYHLAGREFIADTNEPSQTWAQKYIHPDDQAQVMATISRAIRNKSVFELEHRVIRVDGSLGWTFSRAIPIRDAAGEIVEWFGMASDITAHKQSEIALIASEAKYRLLFENMTEIFQILEPVFDYQGKTVDFRYFEVNPATEILTGRKRAEIEGKTAKQLWGTVEIYWIEMLDSVLRTGKPSHMENYSRELDKYYDVYAWKLDDHRVAVMFSDITARKRVETTLALLADISQFLTIATDEREIIETSARRIGEHFQVAHCLFAELDRHAQTMRVLYDWRADPAAQGLSGTYPLEVFGTPDLFANFAKGIPLVSENVALEEHIHLETFEAHDVTSGINAPFVSEGIVKAAIIINQPTARRWRRDEIDLLQELTRRIWTRIEKSRAQEALRASEERLRLAYEAAQIGAFDWNLETGVNAWTPELESMYGLPPGEFGKTPDAWVKLIHPEDRPTTDRWAQEAIDTEQPLQREFRIIRPDGSVRWIATRFQAFKNADGKPVRISGVNIDITARKQTETALRVSEQRHRMIYEHASTGIAITDMDGRFESCNPAYCSLLGYTEDELKQMNFAALVHPDDRAENLLLANRLKNGELDQFEIHSRSRRKDGKPLWLRKFVYALPDSTGKPAHLAALVTDTTERVQWEKSLREADRRKDEFLATLAHELRNPLAPIRNGLQILQYSRGDNSTTERAIEMMQRQVDYVVRLVDDLTDMSRISRGKIELRKRRVDLTDVLHDAVETSRPNIDEARHQLKIELPAEPLVLEADPVRLTQIITNLLNNAAKYTPEGGEIRLAAWREGPNAVTSVSDNGVGISSEMLPTVFDLFTQVDRTHRTQGGLGIGLTIARRLAEMHGGSIEATSAGRGKGSEFVLRLPLAVATRKRPDNNEHQDPPAAIPRHRILVVDDDQDVAHSFAMLLNIMGAEATTANDGASALETIKRFRPSVVFQDISMPQMDGYEFARRVRQMSEGQDVTLIAVTGWDDDHVRSKARKAGINHVLVKPVTARDLETLLATIPVNTRDQEQYANV